MIINCDKCNKNFEINSNLIPENGRLLQCGNCDHVWHHKKKNINNIINKDKTNDNEESGSNGKSDSSRVKIERELLSINEDDFLENNLEKKFDSIKKENFKKNDLKKDIVEKKQSKPLKYVNFLSLIIVFIISIAALIVIFDTFKSPLSILIPDLEFMLYNFYETVKDVILFTKDLLTN